MEKINTGCINTKSEVRGLDDLTTEELGARWRRVFMRPLPPNPRREFPLLHQPHTDGHGRRLPRLPKEIQTESKMRLCIDGSIGIGE